MSNTKKVLIASEESCSGSKSDSADDFFKDLLVEEMIHPGLILKDDYLLLIKIGYGNNAGVWMTYQLSTKAYLAIKIQDYECYDDGCREVKIIKKINEWSKNNKSAKNQSKGAFDTNCIKMLDFFEYQAPPNYKFVCSVYELYAGSIHMLIASGKYKYGLPIPVVKNICKQLLRAVSFLHLKAEIIHTDIKPENILFKGTPKSHTKVIDIFTNSLFPAKYETLKLKYASNQTKFVQERDHLAMESVSELQFIKETFENHVDETDSNNDSDGSIIEGEDDFNEDEDDENESESSSESESRGSGSTSEEPINTRKQSVPDYISFMQNRKTESIDHLYDFETVLNNRENSTDKASVIDDTYVNNCKIVLTDFGNSYFYKRRTEHEIQDRIYRSPEVILDFKYSYAADMWSVGCVVFELLTGFPLFNVLTEPLTKDIHHLYLMEKLLGPMPLVMKKKSKRSKFLFDSRKNYHIKNLEKISRMSIYNILVKQHLFSETHARSIADFLSTVLQYNPQKRITADEMIKHQWLNSTD